MPITDSKDNRYYVYQTPTVFNRPGATVVQDTWYTIFEIEEAFKIYNLVVNVETANETLEVQALTLDGVLIPATDLAATAGVAYFAVYADIITTPRIALQADSPRRLDEARSYFMEGKQVELQMRKTTALGAGDLNALIVNSLYQ